MDKQPKCFVPSCNNDVGVLFPKNPIVKKKWLKSLGLDHLNLKIGPNSFVCLDHFEEDGQPYAPSITTSEVPSSKEVPEKTTSVKIGRTTRHSSYQAGIPQKRDNPVEVEAIKRELLAKTGGAKSKKPASKEIGNNQPATTESVKKQEEEIQDHKVHGNYNSMCRLCMQHFSAEMESIFNKIDRNHTIAHIISVCLNPIQISPTDKLSKFICAKCLASVKEYFKFHQFCLGMDAKQRELLSIEQEYPSDGHDADSDNSEEYLHEERLSDYEENKENKDKSISGKTNGHIFKLYSSDQEKKTKDQNSVKKSDIDLKFDRVEEELARVLEGGRNADIESEKITQPEKNTLLSEETNSYQPKVTGRTIVSVDTNKKNVSNPSKSFAAKTRSRDDEIYTENIIIEMINDEETQQATPNIKLPITIKRINSDTSKKTPVKKKRSNSNSFNNPDQNVTMIKRDNSQEIVVLPRGISVEVKERFYSPLGIYECQGVKYLFNSEFLLAGGYLYEYWLAKEKIRNLHCVVARCPAVAIQARIDYYKFSNEIEVIRAHDHEPPDAMERKRQMFYNIMYSKMRKDRNFNFKLLYEQFCKLDHELTDILPLRKVISEICKQGPIVQPPVMNFFDQFYNSIDNDAFHKIHFTDHHVQFYQDRFETDDGSRAIVFANPEVVKSYSYSKLMYVDASFHIESTDFPYRLLTVLVWVYESYYPILYAFVNSKSQDLYRQIFSFLYNTLAPNLRPDEIITDYEANLYYALGETYIESSIGGSMFYFTQNLYKKICVLNLSKELDLNSNFRSIYNMLLMLPLLPVNTILDGLNNIEVQAKELGLQDLTRELFMHVHDEWICNVTPEFFCVHRLENRINENIVAPFKKLRDLIMLSRSKSIKTPSVSSVVLIIEKIIELEKFLRDTYSGSGKKTFAKDLSSSQKKIVLKAWHFIENHPKININHFFLKVLGYIKCLENQLWIWGFYRYEGDTNDELINANNFSIVNVNHELEEDEENQEDAPMEEGMEEEHLESQEEDEEEAEEDVIEEFYIEDGGAIRRVSKNSSRTLLEEISDKEQKTQTQDTAQHSEKEQPAVLMEAVLDENGSFVLQNTTKTTSASSIDSNIFVYK